MINRIFWSWYALCYDVLTVFGPYQKMLTEIKKHLGLQTGVSYKILDAACGTGNLEVLLKKEKDLDLDITAIDFSLFMLNRAKKKLKGINGINILSCDLSQPLPFGDSTFDRIVTVNAFHFLSSPQKTLAEFFRVLKPGGLLVITVLRHDHNPLMVLKSFKHEDESEKKWKTKNLFLWFYLVFRVFGFSVTAFKFVFVAIFNKSLDKYVKGFKKEELNAMFLEEGFRVSSHQLVYGDQNFLYSVKKFDNFFIKKVRDDNEYNGMIKIRKEVFIEEYNLPLGENDLDERDQYSNHFIFCSVGQNISLEKNKLFFEIGTMRFVPFNNNFFTRWPILFPAHIDLSNSVEISKLCFLKLGRNKKNLILFLEFIYCYAKNKHFSCLCGATRPIFLILLKRIGISFTYVGDVFLDEGIELVGFVSGVDENFELLQNKVIVIDK